MSFFTGVIPLLFLFILLIECSSVTKNYQTAIQNSNPGEIDLVLVPNKYNLVDLDWIFEKSISTYKKSDLEKELAKYGRTIKDLQAQKELSYKEMDDIVSLQTACTIHFSSYDYDTRIPLLLKGDKWFRNGIYSEEIQQQHIVPTLSKILHSPLPNGVTNSSLNYILKDSKEIPELILFIVIDQGGQVLFEAHPEEGKFIRSLMQSSAYFPNAKVSHLDAHTAVGHASIGTGAFPIKHGILTNKKISVLNGQVSIKPAYIDNKTVQPTEMLTESFADTVDRHFQNESVIISQSYAIRAAIGMAGHGASSPEGDRDFVYWMNKYTGKWFTDEKYYTLPDIPYPHPIESHLKQNPNGVFRDFKVTKKDELKKYWDFVMAGNAELEAQGEFLRRMIQKQIFDKNLHRDGKTDLVFYNLKAIDAAGHLYGWESLEVKEAFRKADEDIRKLIELMDKNLKDKYILALAADHGCAPMPEISGGKRLDMKDIFLIVDSLLPEELRKSQSLISYATTGQISLNRKLLKSQGINLSAIREKILSIKVDGEPFFKDVIISNKDIDF